ncbi:mvp-type potassium channel superfamily protein (plasmid) [Haloferax gibbonsii]|uniref:Mvp-type potassium channel superfamily protein n=2 Tax=Haloferax gibbonsii TaxID=35746 RepID=A0A871BM90_HALGI|nr:mvp-type potassium channel superfamily protein [Haloferax gibbonsii]
MAQMSRDQVWTVVDPESENRWGERFSRLVFLLASANVVAVVLSTVESLSVRFGVYFDGLLVVSIALFTVLYVVRLWAAGSDAPESGRHSRVAFVRDPIAVVDCFVIVTFWVGLLFEIRLFESGLFRVFWLARVLNLSWFRRSRGRFKRVIDAQRSDLGVAFSGAGMLVLVSSTLMYFVEGNVQPEAFSSIPETLWWGVVTLTTVGYGDVVPVTPLGRLLGAVTMLGGVAFFALPSSILAAGFFAERTGERMQPGERTRPGEGPRFEWCPYCGESLDAESSHG